MTQQTFPHHADLQIGAALRRHGTLLVLLAGIFVLALYVPHRAERETESAPFHQQTLAQSDTTSTLEAFQMALDSMRDRYGFPGATAAYVWTDGTSGTAATGRADLETGTPMTPDARMLAASIGKTFVGATAAALAEEGVLDLDAPIAQWLADRPWFERLPNHEHITLRHLLTHRSGLPDHVHLDGFAAEVSRQWRKPGLPFTPEALVQFTLDEPPLFDAGEGWAYTDTGFILVGLIIEEATGRDYYDLIQERFLTPLDLRGTSPSNRRDLPGLAAGYATENALGLPRKTTMPDGTMAWHPGLEWTGGGLVSTSGDLARWGAALFGGTALPEAALDLMLTSSPIDPDMPGIHYGMGVAMYQGTPSGPIFGHGGWIPGYTSSLRYYDDYGVAIAFQINTDIGLESDTTSVVQDMESRLAEVVLSSGKRASRTQ
jgi:D-alanyl-D-alanine carboxypeptidase